MRNEIISTIQHNSHQSLSLKLKGLCFAMFCIITFSASAQVTSAVDSTSIRIGAQVTYNITVETDSSNLVVFPEAKNFGALEIINSYPIDTLKNDAKFSLIKKYGVTQFDSGTYTLPRQKLIIGDRTVFTDSIQIEVRNIAIDTTKQKLYDIKPIIEVDKTGSNWWLYLLIAIVCIAAIGAILWWFIWREKPLTEDQKIALLPPYDRAKLALKKLDESDYLQHEELKDYYSELTLIIRKYLDEKVYDHALESTTDELVSRLRLLKEGNQIDLSPETIKNIESILRRADLVKFAKSEPDIALAELDRNTIDTEIDHVKEVLPEPTEEEKLLDEQYRQDQERKQKRKKVWITVGISLFLIIATLVGFSLKYGFSFVKDTIIGHDSKELLESEWVTSQYGVPPVFITTPKVLKRTPPPIPEELKAQVDMTLFGYGSLLEGFNIYVTTTTIKNLGENKIELDQVASQAIALMEKQGVANIMLKNDKFTTPAGAEGIKVYGTADFPSPVKGETYKGNYTMLLFNSENVIQQVYISSKLEDSYADRITERIINSVELKIEEE